jgi:hypothetical protein
MKKDTFVIKMSFYSLLGMALAGSAILVYLA